jgi:hypothetical protein
MACRPPKLMETTEGGLQPARGFSLALEFLHLVQLGWARWLAQRGFAANETSAVGAL